jgi:hypothetical protein
MAFLLYSQGESQSKDWAKLDRMLQHEADEEKSALTETASALTLTLPKENTAKCDITHSPNSAHPHGNPHVPDTSAHPHGHPHVTAPAMAVGGVRQLASTQNKTPLVFRGHERTHARLVTPSRPFNNGSRYY